MKKLEDMNLVDDFLVNSLTSHKVYGERASRYILECILGRKIGKLTVIPQRFLAGENPEAHGVRMDVYLDEEDGEILISNRTEMVGLIVFCLCHAGYVFIIPKWMQVILSQEKSTKHSAM